MRRYIEHIRSKEPHERRAHALRAAGVITALFVVAWVATLPARLNTGQISQAQSDQAAAAAAAAYAQTPQLEVASTTMYTY